VKRTNDTDKRVAGIAAGLLDSLRSMRRSCTETEHNPRAQRIARAMLDHNDPRQFGCEHLSVLFVDAFDRGCPEEEVLAFAEELKAEIRYLYAQRDGFKPEPLPEAHQAEEHAEGQAEEAELAFVYQPSGPTFFQLQEKKHAHINASLKLLETARQQALRGIHS
jgi:hypothetical protein